MYTLYGMTGACSMAVHVILNELGAKSEYIDVRVPQGEPRPAEFLKVNPRGNVPVLVDDGHVIREGGAIIAYLLDKENSPMLPKSGTARANALEWLMFANATMHPAYSNLFFLLANNAAPELVEAALAKINKQWKEVDTQLAKTTYVTGNDISGADILLTVIANWAQDSFGQKIVLGDNTKRLIKAVIARPAYVKTLADEKVEYKAAA